MCFYVSYDPLTNRSMLQLWDVITDQDAVDLIRDVDDAEKASQMLVDFALKNDNMISRDNVTVMIIRFNPGASRITL